jgi:hypothetical protein
VWVITMETLKNLGLLGNPVESVVILSIFNK